MIFDDDGDIYMFTRKIIRFSTNLEVAKIMNRVDQNFSIIQHKFCGGLLIGFLIFSH